MSQSQPSTAASKSKPDKKQKLAEKLLKEEAEERKHMHDHLIREETFKSVSVQRGWEEWKAWCEELAVKGLREELCAVAKSVDCFMDKSNLAEQTIRQHRTHAADQHLRLVQNHSEVIDYIMGVFNVFHEAADELYDLKREKLLNDFYSDGFERDRVLHGRQNFYENVAHTEVSKLKSDLNQLGVKFVEKKFDVEAESVIKREESMTKAEKAEAIACSEIRNLVNFFNRNLWPKGRLNEYQKSLKKSIESDAATEELNQRTGETKKIAAKLNEKLQTFSRAQLAKLSELKSEQLFLLKLKSLKEAAMASDRISDREKILQLIESCGAAKKRLKKILEQSENIRKNMEICAKYEKICDAVESSPSGSFESLEAKTQALDGFFTKLSKVEADCVMLRNLKANLTKGNESLKVQIDEEKFGFEIGENMKLLQIDLSPSVGKICQISHQIPQIKTSVKMNKLWKLCKSCKEHFL